MTNARTSARSLTRTAASSRWAARTAASGAWLWLVPVLLIGLIYFSPKHLVSAGTAVAGLLGLGIVAIAARWPDRALITLIVLLPFQTFLLAKLWAVGVPTSIVRHLGAWKEALAIGVVVAGVRNYVASGRRADAVDRLALGFIAIAALYLVAQRTIVPSAPSSSSIRLLGFREDAGFVILLLGARHAALPQDFLPRVGRAVVAVGAVVAGVCVFEMLASSAWNRFVVNTIKYTNYQTAILHTPPLNPHDIRFYGTIGGAKIVRAGSVFLNALTCGFYLVLAFAVALERVARGLPRRWVIASLPLIGGGILLTQTRSAILAALVVAFIAFQPAAGRRRHWRVQLGILMAALAIVAIPTAFATGLAERVATAPTRTDTSTRGHIAGFSDGINVIAQHPLGQGLGTSAGTGQRFQSQVSDVVVPENNYLQFGAELGLPAMLLFVALTITLIVKLRAAARRHADAMITAAWAAMSGLAVAAWFLHTWVDFPTAWTAWGVAGGALGMARRRADARAREPAPAKVQRTYGSRFGELQPSPFSDVGAGAQTLSTGDA